MIFAFSALTTSAQTDKDKKIMEDAENAKEMLMETNPELKTFFTNSVGYAIFPNVGKGGLIVGGASGNGVLFENGKATGMADLKKISVGLQAGGQSLIQALFFEDEKALNEFKNGDFELSAGASAVIVESGAAINYSFNEGIAIFALPKAGAMADLTVKGQKFDFESFENMERSDK